METREEIIELIKKWSVDHEGRTPAERVFREDTGIPLNTLQKHGWASYGELCDDAGLSRNKFDKTKYQNDELCESFIVAIRDKNKWPTRGELEVRQKKDKTFPGSSTYYKKLGLVNTGALPKTILEYINGKSGYEDIEVICNTMLEKIPAEAEFSGDQKEDKGWVYLYRLGTLNRYKVGKTNNLLRRGREIAATLPEKTILIHSIPTNDISGVEVYWLTRFRKTATELENEWFMLSNSNIKEFKAWKKIA